MKALILVLTAALCGLGSFSARAATSCAPSIGSCDYYLCRETAQNCGPQGYLQGFGHYYCQGFLDDIQPKVSPAGALWLNKVATCLQAALDELPLSAGCEATHGFAIRTHATCYVSTGWCELGAEDKLKVMSEVYKEARDPRVDWEFMKIMNDCAGRKLRAPFSQRQAAYHRR